MPSSPDSTDDKDSMGWPEGYFESFGPIGEDFVEPEPLPPCPHRDDECSMCRTLHVPNAETLAAMAEADEILRTRRLRFKTAAEVFEDLEKNSR